MYSKQKIALRYWLLGRGYHMAIRAMEFAGKHHTGLRKDGVTPEFSHQIAIAHYVRTLPDLRNPETTLAIVFLHDVREDFNVSDEQIRILFGNEVADGVDCMSKVINGSKRDPAALFDRMALDPFASIAKGGDRIHNFNSMIGVFTPEKQISYVEEGVEFFLPMIKKARRNFPDQERAYENIKHMLESQIAMIRGSLAYIDKAN